MQNFAFKFQTVAEKTAKNVRGLLYFSAPGCRVGVGCVTNITKNMRPNADCGLSWPTSLFHTTIGVCKILSRSVGIWQYEGQKPVWSKTENDNKCHLAFKIGC